MAKNVLWTELQGCCFSPMTWYFRDGYCKTQLDDMGVHTVCACMTDEFLEFSQKQGNDLITPVPDYDFPWLKAGDFWCLCASRWLEAHQAGCAPKVKIQSCHENTLKIIPLEILQDYIIE